MGEEEKPSILERWVQKDWWVILIFILCLAACLYTLNSVGEYQQRINDAWIAQWDASGCAARYNSSNITFMEKKMNIRNAGDIYYEMQNRNQNATGSGTSNST